MIKVGFLLSCCVTYFLCYICSPLFFLSLIDVLYPFCNIQLQNLRQLLVHRPKRITGAFLDHISGITSLVHLELSFGLKADTRHLAKLALLTGLTNLTLRDARLSDHDLLLMQSLTRLRTLLLRGASIFHLSPIAQLPRLKHLTLQECASLQDGGLRAMCSNTCLEMLDLRNLKGITCEGLR